ncbi:MAG TPA: carboxyl transferase domain-containing protein [Acidobacteriota bacterium]|jgi:acetyl-CoA carboxylase carboxyltransferase component|nr:carboxyl transferase domain-containing protein [Acidobacteriota bacterium]
MSHAILRRQWQELLSRWPRDAAGPAPLRQGLIGCADTKRGEPPVDFLIPLGNLAGTEMKRPAAAAVSCDIIAYQNRPCVAVGIGEPGKTSSLDVIALKKILRAQTIALSGGLPIAFFWFGRCEIARDDSEIFPDFDAAGVLIQRAAMAGSDGSSQFIYCEQVAGVGGTLARALPRRLHDDRHAPAYRDFLTWLEKHATLPALQEPAANCDPADLMPLSPSEEYNTRDIIATLVDAGSFVEYRAEYGRTLICGYARIGTMPVGIVANQKKHVRDRGRPFEFGGVIYSESASKGARFILDCNQNSLPLLFLQDVNGFMVGRDAEISGIIRSGAKMVNAVANSIVPKITLILGGSYGAGNYAMCGKAYEPLFIFGWPTARYAVMGGEQAARTLCDLQIRQAESSGKKLSEKDRGALFERLKKTYDDQIDPRYAAARLWIDHIVFPGETRALLFQAFRIASYSPRSAELKTGVIQT